MKVKEFISNLETVELIDVRDKEYKSICLAYSDTKGLDPYMDKEVINWYKDAKGGQVDRYILIDDTEGSSPANVEKDKDYRETVLSQGLVCFNKNNHQYCVVIDGQRGTEDDRCSMVLEFSGKDGFFIHTPPNRALEPTGRICNLKFLAKVMSLHVSLEE